MAAGRSQAKTPLHLHEKCQYLSNPESQHGKKNSYKSHTFRNKDNLSGVHISNTERDGYRELFGSLHQQKAQTQQGSISDSLGEKQGWDSNPDGV